MRRAHTNAALVFLRGQLPTTGAVVRECGIARDRWEQRLTRTGDEVDIVDEALALFRANVLFRNFEVHGSADRVLIYLTLFIHLVRSA